MLNGLRNRIRVQADGQMKTGRDVVIGALDHQLIELSLIHI
nr:glutamate synthase-related protein [Ralstonia sp. ASV6]